MELLAKLSSMFGGQKGSYPGFSVERFYLNRRTRLNLNDDNLLDAYSAHELVYACINKIADVMNDAEIVVEKKNRKGEWEKVEGHMLASLFKRPNKWETGRDFRRLMVQSEQAAGIFYAEIVRSGAGVPVELIGLNPERIEPKLGADNLTIAYYEYTRTDGTTYRIKPQNLLVRRRVDLVNRYYGLSPLAVALKSVNSDIGLTDYIDAFFESDGTPSGILKILNQSINDAKAQALQANWMQKYSRRGSNHKGVAVLDQNADFQKIGSGLNELDTENVSNRFESRVCSVFGVPPILVGALVGLKHSTTNATAKAALQDFWENKVSPELAAFREWLTWFVLPEFEDIGQIQAEKLRVGFDISQIAFLQENADGIHARARENFKAGFWTLNEARIATGMPPDDEKGTDYYVQPANVVAITPENRMILAERERPELPAPDDNKPTDEDDTGDTEPEAAEDEDGEENGDKSQKKKSELKSFDYDGLTLYREPSAIEQIIGLKAIAGDLESEKAKLKAALLVYRDRLIEQAAEKIDKFDTATVYQLTLTPVPKARKQLERVVRDAFTTGRRQVAREFAAQLTGKAEFKDKDFDSDEDFEDFLDTIIDVMISKLINEVQSRAINLYVTLKLLVDYTVERLMEMLSSQSDAFVEETASSTANAAIQAGRSREAQERSDEWEKVVYSAILDSGTCGLCADADGMEATDEADLPDAPNPACEGGWRCRCFHIFVAKAEV